jgi:hypothetical protein
MKRGHADGAAAAAVAGDEPGGGDGGRLTLAHEHALSQEVARQCDALNADTNTSTNTSTSSSRDSGWMASCGVSSCRVISPGIVELLIKAGNADGFGSRAWPFRIGGEGVGDDPHMAAALGTAPRSPVAARFHCPFFSMVGLYKNLVDPVSTLAPGMPGM